MMTTKIPLDVTADLQRARAARKDELDLPRTLTERQVCDYVAHTAALDNHLRGIRSELDFIAGREAKRAPLQASLDRLKSAEATIAKQIEDAADWRTVTDARERDKEWARQQAFRASITALTRGVEFFNGEPALPMPLRELLTDTCTTCGHAELQWAGPINALEQEILALTKQIDERRVYLESHLQGAAALLTAPQPA